MTKYCTIVADPPWPISWPSGGTRSAGKTEPVGDKAWGDYELRVIAV